MNRKRLDAEQQALYDDAFNKEKASLIEVDRAQKQKEIVAAAKLAARQSLEKKPSLLSQLFGNPRIEVRGGKEIQDGFSDWVGSRKKPIKEVD